MQEAKLQNGHAAAAPPPLHTSDSSCSFTTRLRRIIYKRNGCVVGNRISINLNRGASEEEVAAELRQAIEALQKQIAETRKHLVKTQQQLSSLQVAFSSQQKGWGAVAWRDQSDKAAEGNYIIDSESGSSSPRGAFATRGGQDIVQLLQDIPVSRS